MINDNLKLTGALTIAINDTIVQKTENLVVTAGKEWVADRMNNANTVMTYMSIGTGTTAAAAGNTTLVTELDRNALSSTTVTGANVAYVASWAAGDGTGAITEAGIFNSVTNGSMLARTTFNVVNKGEDDSMTITWTVTVS